jgi:hypothetical protein
VSHFLTWVCLVVAIVIFRMVGTDIPLIEHIAGIYFSGVALALHWAKTRLFGG